MKDVATILRGRIKGTPDDPRLHFDLGRILYRLKQPTEARQSLQEAHRLHRYQGRQFRLTDVHGKLVRGILA